MNAKKQRRKAAKPTRRSDPYLVITENGHKCRVSAYWFHAFVKCGWLIMTTREKTARLRYGVKAWVEGAMLRLENTLNQVSEWISLNCRMIEKRAIYDLRGHRMTPVMLQREIQRDYCMLG